MNKTQVSAPPSENLSLRSWLVEEYYELLVSVSIIIFISLVSQLIRITLARAFVPKSWIRILVNEIVATAELCATCFELGNIAETYGVSYYGLFYFFSSLWWAVQWKEAYACPTTHLEDYLSGETDAGTAAVVSATEILTGCLAFRLFVKPIWAFQSIQLHVEKFDGVCVADLSVTPLYGSLIEGGGTVIFSILSKRISASMESERLSTVLNSVLDTLLVITAYEYSGGYFNPLLATSMQYGCDGATLTEHLLVYWVGGIMGTVLGLTANRISERTLKED